MVEKIIYKISIILSVSFLFSNGYNPDEVLARVGKKEITVKDFLRRSEYSPRPLYCRGNTNLDKRIILNLDLDQVPKGIEGYLSGRKKQKMREILFEKVSEGGNLKAKSFSHWFDLYEMEYDISYLSIFDIEVVASITKEIKNKMNLNDIYYQYSDKSNIPTLANVSIFNIDNRALREKLFETKLNTGDIIGPILTDDHITMFVQIDRVGRKIDLNPNSISQKHEEIKFIIDTHIGESLFQYYVEDLMDEMSFTLNPDIYPNFVELVEVWYSEIDKKKKDHEYEILISDIQLDQTLLTLNSKDYSVANVIGWIDTHPIVFRDGYYKNLSYSNQVKFALADLIRDNQLDSKAIELKLDEHPSVISEFEMWYDNYCALELRDIILGKDVELSSINVDENLNEHFISLAQKYSNDIMINIDLLDAISISSIDMIAYNKAGPYRFLVPQFPIITNHHQFDYGQSVTMESK